MSNSIALTRMQPRGSRHGQNGSLLLDAVLYTLVAAIVVAGVMSLKALANNGVSGNQAAEGTVTLAGNVSGALGPNSQAKSYAAVSASWLNSQSLVPQPFTYDGTNIVDPWGNTVVINGTTKTWAMTVGGTQQLAADICSKYATSMGSNVQVMMVGPAATAASGAVSGGTAYKTAAGVYDATALSHCGDAATVIAMQFK